MISKLVFICSIALLFCPSIVRHFFRGGRCRGFVLTVYRESRLEVFLAVGAAISSVLRSGELDVMRWFFLNPGSGRGIGTISSLPKCNWCSLTPKYFPPGVELGVFLSLILFHSLLTLFSNVLSSLHGGRRS